MCFWEVPIKRVFIDTLGGIRVTVAGSEVPAEGAYSIEGHDDGSNYYFLAGILSVNATEQISTVALSYGFTYINGNHIITGKIDCGKCQVHGANGDVIIDGNKIDVQNGKITVRNPSGEITIEDGIVKCQGLVVGAQEFTTDLIFEAESRFKASWTGPSPDQGKIYFADGSDSGAINDGDTGDVYQKVFIYYNGTATLQTTTDHATAVGDDNLLLAIVEPVVTGQGKCKITLVRNPGTTISGDTIVTGKIQSQNEETYFDLEKDEIGIESSEASADTKIWIGTHILNKGDPGSGRGHIFLGRWLEQAGGKLPADDGLAVLHNNGDYTLISEDGMYRKRSGYTLPYGTMLYCSSYKSGTIIWSSLTVPAGRKLILSFTPRHTYKDSVTSSKWTNEVRIYGVPCKWAEEDVGEIYCMRIPSGTMFSGDCPFDACTEIYYEATTMTAIRWHQKFVFVTGSHPYYTERTLILVYSVQPAKSVQQSAFSNQQIVVNSSGS